jgi:hypothetical protein
MGHPLPPQNFGSEPGAIQVHFHNGASAVTGYIVKQLGSRRFVCTTDGNSTFICDLADTTGSAASLTAGLCTIPLVPPGGGPTQYVRAIQGTLLTTTDGNQYLYGVGAESSSHAGIAAVPSAPVVSAVSFNGATYLHNTALQSTNSSLLSYSVWVNPTVLDNTYGYGSIIFDVDPQGDALIIEYIERDAPHHPKLTLNNQSFTQHYQLRSSTPVSANSGWHHILVSVDMTDPLNVRGEYYLNGQDTTDIFTSNISSQFTMMFSGLPLFVGYDTFDTGGGFRGGMYDAWFAPGVSLLDVNGELTAEVIAKFRDPATGLPVDLGQNGELPTGTSPEVFLKASAGAPTSFATNRGTGQNFTVVGSLTEAASTPLG